MKIQIVGDNFDKKQYNNLAIHPLQSWQWGEARKKMGIQVLRLGEFDVGNRHACSLQNVYQITFHKIPYTNYKIGYLPRSRFPSKTVLDFLLDYSKKNNVVFIKIEPYVEKGGKNVILNLFQDPISKKQIPKPASKRGEQVRNDISDRLVKSSHPLFPDWTIIFDLDKSEDELLKNMKSKTRYNIRLAQKKGVVVKEESNEKGFEIFSRLYFETCKRQNYKGHNPVYHKIFWENLKKDLAHILVAYHQNTPLAAYELFLFKNTFYYPYGGTSEEMRNLMASNLIMWEAIRLGKNLGADKFDMWGSLPPTYPQNHPWAGFTRFKEGYSGRFVKMAGSFDLIVNPLMYKLYNFTQTLREIYLKLNF